MTGRRLTDAELLDALDDLIIEDILSMSGAELRAEIMPEGGDPDAIEAECRASLERAIRECEAALSGQLIDGGDQAIPRRLGLPDPLVTGRAVAVEQPLDGRLRLDEGAPHPPQRALPDLLPQRHAGSGVVGVDVGHAGDSEAVPAAGQARSDAEKAPAGGLPAAASFW